MSMDQFPDVIDGSLNWEVQETAHRRPTELDPHPKNSDIYGDTDGAEDLSEDFLRSVEQKGVLEPLVINTDQKVISGHRRRLAAVETDVETVPVRIVKFDSELAEREALVEFNRQRRKSPAQVINEFQEMLAIERKRAAKRKRHQTEDHPEPVPGAPETGDARDLAADRLDADLSGRTLERGAKIKETVEDPDAPDTVRQVAERVWDNLEKGEETITSGFDSVKEAQNKHDKAERKQAKRSEFNDALDQSDVLDIHHGDFRNVLVEESVQYDHILTDPPYNGEAVHLYGDLAELAAEQLPPGGFVVSYSGKSHLFEVLSEMDAHLEYYWQAMIWWNGEGALYWPRNIRTNYHAIPVFAKPPADPLHSRATDVIHAQGAEKDFHEWQQPLAESETLVKRFTEPNDVILDPMCGSGTVGLAALKNNRRVVLIDRDQDALDSAKERLHDTVRALEEGENV